jgi:hypothetical protein
VVKGIYLTLLIGPTVPVPVPQFALDALTGVEVSTRDEGASGFQLSFTLNNRSPLHTLFLLAGGQQQIRVRVIIIVTFNGMPNVLMDGMVTHQQVAPGGDAGHSTLMITGEDLSVAMDDDERNGEAYSAMSVETCVTTILARYGSLGIVPLVVPSVMIHVPLPTQRIPMQYGTDLAYVRLLAERVGHVFYIDPGPAPGMSVAYWGPRVKVAAPQPALNIDMDAHTNVESLNFSFDGRERTEYVVRIQDEKSKKSTDVPVPDTTLLNPPLGAIPPLKVKKQIVKTAKLTMTEATLLALSLTSRSLDAVSGSGTLDVLRYGRILKARQLVGVRGAGPAFDGLHYVKSVTHVIKPGEYKQSFELARNGLISTVPMVPA